MLQKRKSLRTKLNLIFCLIITVAFAVCALISYLNFSKNLKRDAQNYLDLIVENVTGELNGLIQSMSNVTTTPYYSNCIRIISEYEMSGQNYIPYNYLSEIYSCISSIMSMEPRIYGAHILMNNGRVFGSSLSNSYDYSIRWSLEDNHWIKECSTNGSIYFVPYHLSSFYKGMEKYMVSFVRALNNLGDFHTMGYIKIDLNADSFKMCVPVQSMYGEQIFLFNANKEIIYPYPVSGEQEIYDRYYSMRNGNYLMSRSKTKNLDVEVIGFLPVDKYHNNTYDLLWGLLITYFITLLFTILLISLITNQIVRPIQDIKLAIEKIIQHDFSVRVKINTNDELGELGEGFNWMAKEINQLLLDEKAAFLREQQAQFSLLFGQISPHFMYNTLESMSSMALVDGNYELSDGIVALSRLLRHTINKNETLVYLRDEVSFVQNYIKLQTLSMGERINFNFEVDIAHEYLFIPKFILQPLVENIYEHASTSYRLDAWIRSGISGNKLILSIIDNGMGIPPKRLEYIRNRLYSNATEITPPTEKNAADMH